MSVQTQPKPLSRLRFALAVAAGVYPAITAILYLLWPVIAAWPLWEKTLAVVPLMVPTMVWASFPPSTAGLAAGCIPRARAGAGNAGPAKAEPTKAIRWRIDPSHRRV